MSVVLQCGTHTPAAPQQLFTAHTKPPGHSLVFAQGRQVSPHVHWKPFAQPPPPSGVWKHRHAGSSVHAMKLLHVAPAHSGSGLPLLTPWARTAASRSLKLAATSGAA